MFRSSSQDPCGIAVLRAEALERLGRVTEALAIVEQAGADEKSSVARIVAAELGEHHQGRLETPDG